MHPFFTAKGHASIASLSLKPIKFAGKVSLRLKSKSKSNNDNGRNMMRLHTKVHINIINKHLSKKTWHDIKSLRHTDMLQNQNEFSVSFHIHTYVNQRQKNIERERQTKNS